GHPAARRLGPPARLLQRHRRHRPHGLHRRPDRLEPAHLPVRDGRLRRAGGPDAPQRRRRPRRSGRAPRARHPPHLVHHPPRRLPHRRPRPRRSLPRSLRPPLPRHGRRRRLRPPGARRPGGDRGDGGGAGV
ncbi:MAG: hypothetical protein AVDCRST_MAG68-3612, partial [uncultured Gemmatimonadetes bacterium]